MSGGYPGPDPGRRRSSPVAALVRYFARPLIPKFSASAAAPRHRFVPALPAFARACAVLTCGDGLPATGPCLLQGFEGEFCKRLMQPCR